MAEKTTNFKLTKPSTEDFYDVNVQNENMDIIDGALTDVYAEVSSIHSQTDALTSSSSEHGAWLASLNYDVSEHKGSANPHGITASTVGLGNVPNVATNDQTPTYSEASTLTALTSGEKMSSAFGKIKKAIADLISHLSSTTKHNNASGSGGALGQNAITSIGGALGYNAKTTNSSGTAIDAIQLGTGTNQKEKTLQVYTYQLLDALGVIPDARISTAYKKIVIGSYVGTGTYISGTESSTNIKAAQNVIQFTSYPRMVFIKRRAVNDFWTIIVPLPDGELDFKSYGGNDYSGGLCYGEVTADYKLTWYAGSQKWSYKANSDTSVVSIQTETIADDKKASLKPFNQLNWEGEEYDYIAICD